jgi:hypothetical protein
MLMGKASEIEATADEAQKTSKIWFNCWPCISADNEFSQLVWVL